MEMRSHQVEIVEFADLIISGAYQKNSLTLDCVPGGGKTGAATLFSNRLLDANIVDAVLWLVPRLSLAEQVIDAFAKGVGSCNGRSLEVVDGQDLLFADTLPNMPKVVGCVTTYQSVAHRNNYRRFREAVAARRVLLVLDEVQFLNDDDAAGWYSKVKAVQEAAFFSLVMSGTLWRTDKKPIPFVEYVKGNDGLRYPQSDISYSFRTAIQERAILPTEWRNRSGSVEYTFEGENHLADLLDDDNDEESRKVRTFLSCEKAVHGLLDDMVFDWRDWCQRVYQSRMIVMAESMRQAERWREYLATHHAISCILVTCKEEAAGRKLKHFRERRHGQCLVTVAMAYVGFDCPDLTHLAYLTNTRAASWMLQSFARVSRFDSNAPRNYDSQHAFVYAPDDERMRRFMVCLREEQKIGMAAQQSGGNGFGGKKAEGPAILMPDDFSPISASPGQQAIEAIQGRLTPEQNALLDSFIKTCPGAVSLSKSQLWEILVKGGAEVIRTPGANGVHATP